MNKYIHCAFCFFTAGILWIAVAGSAAAARMPLSDEDLEWVSAQGVTSIIPIAVAAPTNAVNFSPVSTGTVTNVNTITNTNTQLLICVFSVCVNSGLIAPTANSIVAQPSIVSPQTNNFLNSLQSPAFATTSSNSGMVLQVPTVQIPTVQIPMISVPSVRFQFP